MSNMSNQHPQKLAKIFKTDLFVQCSVALPSKSKC